MFLYVWVFFGSKACGILILWLGIESAPPALEGEVLTTGLPGKCQKFYFFFFFPTDLSNAYMQNFLYSTHLMLELLNLQISYELPNIFHMLYQLSSTLKFLSFFFVPYLLKP